MHDRNDILAMVADLPAVMVAWRHGSNVGSPGDDAGDVDLTVLGTRPMTRDWYRAALTAVSMLSAAGSPVRVDTRIGPVAHRRGARRRTVHLSLHDAASFASVSPATRFLLDRGGELLVGQSPGTGAVTLSAFGDDARLWAKALRRDAVPYRRWRWRPDGGGLLVTGWQAAGGLARRRKLLRAAAAMLSSWYWLGIDRSLALARARAALDRDDVEIARRILIAACEGDGCPPSGDAR